MQFAEALAPEEVEVLHRFVQTSEAEQAIEAKFQVVSLPRILQLGGYRKIVPDLSGFDSPSGLFAAKREIPRIQAVPNLAVCHPGGWTGAVFFETGGRGVINFANYQSGLGGPGTWRRSFSIPEWRSMPPTESQRVYRAPLPLLPREARQTLEKYPSGLVLWEADWEPTPVPLRDPAILVPLLNELYAVAYVWDLTELEKKVLTKAFAK